MDEKIIGILGGMGPEATADLYYRIIRATPAKKDGDHPRTIIYSNTKVPDRTLAIIGEGPSPLGEMVKAGAALEQAGADFLIMPCNTAHYFIDDLRAKLGIPVLDMIELTAEAFVDRLPKAGSAGLIATDGTVKSGIYERRFSDKGVDIVLPPIRLQSEAMKAIYDHIKAGDLQEGREIILRVVDELVFKDVKAILCGCTEVSLVLKDGDLTIPVIDPLQVLAEHAVSQALGLL
jgi:aspartate racemase